LTSEKRNLKTALAEAKKTLDAIESTRRSAEKSAREAEKLQAAREAAVAKFLAKWEKSHQVKATKTTRKKRGRPRRAG
ncbi:MAG: hypothetical protein RPU37_03395, partial [Candidatus Sedimenticola sp. (ex Thyasira tokunagai)]